MTLLVKQKDANDCDVFVEHDVDQLPLFKLGDWVKLPRSAFEGMIVEIDIKHKLVNYTKPETDIIYTIGLFEEDDEVTAYEDELELIVWGDK